MTHAANPNKSSSDKSNLDKPLHNLIATESSSINRRQFIGGVAGVAALGLSGCGDDDSEIRASLAQSGFNHGVASGDPLADRVMIWTRFNPMAMKVNQDVALEWLVASDKSFKTIVARGTTKAEAKKNFCVKVDVTGLQPNTSYYYQFKQGNIVSPVGKTKTLPVGDVSAVKLAVFSCANYPAGYFNVYAEAAKRADFDVSIHLGDYIYEYARTEVKDGKTVPAYASKQAKQLNREVLPATEIIGLNDYRTRYAQYRSDPDLQALHATAPMIAVWDDHEIANDAYKTGAENHQENEGSFSERKLAAMMAYHEWMPTRVPSVQQIFRRFDFGSLLSLHMLDTRIIGRDKQLDYKAYMTAKGVDAAKFSQDIANPARQLLGKTQTAWLQQQMATSKATWQVLGQQVLMARMFVPAPILLGTLDPKLGVSFGQYAAIAQKAKAAPATLSATEKAVLKQPKIPYNLDAWDGYAVAREVVLGTAKKLGKNLISLAGDTHNAWASNLTDKDGKPAGVEFATSSVSSPGFEEYLANENPALLAAGLPQLVTDLVYTNTHQRGYMLITARKEACTSEWIFVDTVLSKSYKALAQKSLSVKAGAHKLSI